MIYQYTFTGILAIFLPFFGWAQSTISGIVTGDEGGLAYANVILQDEKIGESTDEEGFFEILNLSAGDYTIVISYLGYTPVRKKIIVKENESKKITIQLNRVAGNLDEVVVSGNLKSTFVSASPIKIDVITSKQLETFLPAASSSIVENIQLVNGVQEVVACGVCYTNNISINGLAGAYTAVLMDGTPIYGNLASVYGLNGIPNMIIDRFEVIKGPSSTLYGSEAVAGVINIITKDPTKEPGVSIDLMGTSHLEGFGNISIAPKFGESSGFVALNWAYVNDFDDYNQDGFGDGINMDRYSLFSKWNIHRKSEKLFTIAAKYYYEDRRNGVKEFVENRNYRQLRGSEVVYGESILTNRMEIFGSYRLNTAPNLKIDYSFSHHDQDSYYGVDNYAARQTIAFSNFLWSVPLIKHDLLIGVSNRYNVYDDNTIATETVQNGQTINEVNRQFIPGIFIQDEYQPMKDVTLLGGLRLDHYSQHGFIVAPRLSIKYKTDDWTTIRGNFGTGFRIVNLFTEDHAFITGQRSVEILEELMPERSYNLSVNVNHIYTAFSGSGTVDLESYFTHFNNKIIPDYETEGKIIYENSSGFAQTMGVGITVNQEFTFPLAFNLGMNIQSVTESEKNGQGELEKRNIEFAPQWSGVFNINYRIRKSNWEFAYTSRVTGKMTLPKVHELDERGIPKSSPRPTVSQPFSLHNLQVSKVFNNQFSMYAGIQNLTNFRQRISPLTGFDDPGYAPGYSPFFDTSYAYAPNHGREFYLGFKWKSK